MPSSDEEELLFGESLTEEKPVLEEKNFHVRIANRLDDTTHSIPKIMKLPSSALSVDFRAPYTPSEGMEEPKSANVIRYRHSEHGTIESNARLIEWEDGSWTLVVGNEHFRVFERKEDVAIFDKQDEKFYVSVCQVEHQLNVIPGSLDSKTHKRVVEQSAVSRKLVESRKVNLASGTAGAAVITSQGSLPSVAAPRQPVQRRQKLTAAFLEAGLRDDEPGASVRDIKSRFRQGGSGSSQSKRAKLDESSSDSEDEEEEDVDFIDDEVSEDSVSSDSSSSGSSSSTSSSSSSSSSSDSSATSS